MHKIIEQEFTVSFKYGVHFTANVFDTANTLLRDVISKAHTSGHGPAKILFVIDSGVASTNPDLLQYINSYTQLNNDALTMVAAPLIIPGGEEAKNNTIYLKQILQAINDFGVCRHSYLIAIGGGALLDLAGFAATIAHRGVRHIRIPTTVLSQNDSGVGVKNSVNAFGKKNFIGTFAPPVAVINDSSFLLTLEDRDWRAGISEAVKVALIKDEAFYLSIKQDAEQLANRDLNAMQRLIYRCAELHMEHIGGADPFEFGSSRPLDFGHWAAHKLEQLSNYELRHGEAVAIGIALDVTYSYLTGLISQQDCDDVLDLLQSIGFKLFTQELLHQETPFSQLSVIKGLTEFREHLGGELTIMLLNRIGNGIEVHKIDENKMKQAILMLQAYHQPRSLAHA